MKLNFRNADATGRRLRMVAVATSTILSACPAFASGANVTMDTLPPLDKTIAGEQLEYPSTARPEISTEILTVPPGMVTQWMTHPVPAYLYVLQGTLTVEFTNGGRQQFAQGQSFLQSRTKWHRGRNDGTTPVRFLAVFVGSKGVPTILHPPVQGNAQ